MLSMLRAECEGLLALGDPSALPPPQLPALRRLLGVRRLNEEGIDACQGHQQVLPCGWLPIRPLPRLL